MQNLIRQFINSFQDDYRIGTEVRLLSSQVREFLKGYDATISFQKFNKLTGCRGRSTGNYYVYDLLILQSLVAEKSTETERLQSYPDSRINTIPYWGSKRHWYQEWNVLLQYVSDLGCHSVLDCFGGSGYISLAASKSGLFNDIVLNDYSTDLYNYHRVMADEVYFEQFTSELKTLDYLSKSAFDLLKQEYYGLEDTVVYSKRENKQILQTVSARRAAQYFALKYYSYDTQGAYSSQRKRLSSNSDSLEQTHKLYRSITLKNLYYKKLLLQHMGQEDWVIILDPVYLRSLRKQPISYEVEFTESQHKALLKVLCQDNLKAKVILCGYRAEADDLYSMSLSKSNQDWHCLRIRRGGQKGDMTGGKEHIWVNFDVDNLMKNYGDFFEQITK